VAGFVAWLTGFRLRRVAFIAGLFLLPVTSIISAALVVLTADLKGPAEAGKDITLAFAVLVVTMAFTSGDASPVMFLMSAALSWSIAMALGGVSYRYRSLTLVVQIAVLLVVVTTLLFMLVVGDTAAFWQQLLNGTIADLPPELVTELGAELAAQGITVEEVVALMATIMTPVFAAGLLSSSLLAVLLGLAWACAARGERFGAQYRTLKLGYVIGGLAALLGIASLLGVTAAGGLLAVVSVAFVLQGVAVLYSWSLQKQWPGAWWALVVLPLLFMPVMPVPALLVGFGLAATGFIDNWYTLRPKTA
jgi:hypothetical protein